MSLPCCSCPCLVYLFGKKNAKCNFSHRPPQSVMSPQAAAGLPRFRNCGVVRPNTSTARSVPTSPARTSDNSSPSRPSSGTRRAQCPAVSCLRHWICKKLVDGGSRKSERTGVLGVPEAAVGAPLQTGMLFMFKVLIVSVFCRSVRREK